MKISLKLLLSTICIFNKCYCYYHYYYFSYNTAKKKKKFFVSKREKKNLNKIIKNISLNSKYDASVSELDNEKPGKIFSLGDPNTPQAKLRPMKNEAGQF